MRVGIDATVIAQARITGIGRFIRNLVGALADTDADHEFTLLYRFRSLKHAQKIWKPRDPRFRVRLFEGPLERFMLPRLDLFHATYQRLPAYQGATPYLGTLHDIFFASRSQMADVETSRRWVARYRDVVSRSRIVMTLSEYSKREIVDVLDADPVRVRVILPAASSAFWRRPAAEIDSARRRYALERPYILFAGGFDRRKNLAGALQAFALAATQLPSPVCLAVAGGGKGLDEARALVPASLADRVLFLGLVPDDDFAALMSGCHVFFFPTLFEGFGLPALEAMSCGAAVLTSSTTSLPEVCGDAALLVHPEAPQAMAVALVRIATDAALREELKGRGAARVARFSWRNVAAHTLDLYREITTGVP
jgi:glycosyltransferase involved in cell wall biosynthesis